MSGYIDVYGSLLHNGLHYRNIVLDGKHRGQRLPIGKKEVPKKRENPGSELKSRLEKMEWKLVSFQDGNRQTGMRRKGSFDLREGIFLNTLSAMKSRKR